MLQRHCFSAIGIGFLGFCTTIVPAALYGQAAVPDENGRLTFQANARTVVVDVVVTGHDGRPVPGLHKQDFLAAEDGHPQTITYFEEHTGAKAQPTNLPALPPNIFTNIPRVTPTDSVTVLVLDSLNTQIADQSNVRAKMLKYLKELPPGHRMAIFTLGTRLSYIEGFTDDPDVLIAALKDPKSEANPRGSPLLKTNTEGDAESQPITIMTQAVAENPSVTVSAALAALRQFQSEQLTSQTDMRVKMTLEALQELANYLAGIPGRKNVVWFSSAFPMVLFPHYDLTDNFADQRNYEDEIRKTDALLASSQVAIYPIAAEGLATAALYDADQRNGAMPTAQNSAQPHLASSASVEQENNSLQNDSQQRNAEHTTMDEVARDTGGTAFYNTNGLNDALARVEVDGSNYYTIAYTPTNTAADGRMRKIQVKLASGNYKLAYRRGYYAPDAKALKATAAKPAGDPLHPFMGPGMPASTQIPLALRVLRGATEPSAAAVPGASPATAVAHIGDNRQLEKQKGPFTRYSVDFIVAARGLQLDATPNGGRHGQVEAALVVYDRDGQPLNWLVRQFSLDMDAARYTQVQENGVNFRLEIDVPQDGASIRSGVYDPSSHLAGTLEVLLSSVVSVNQGASSR